MQIPILNGTYTDKDADFRASYPINMRPVVLDTGISAGYLRPVDGLVKTGVGPGRSRGAINWNGVHYRVMGGKLCQIFSSGQVKVVGTLDDDGKPAKMVYSFNRLAIASAGKLYYYVNGTLSQVTDPDLGLVKDVVWVDGYFMTTDGAFLVVTELSNPFEVNALKYGSSEIDPDPVVAVVKLRNEVYAVNRYTIEVFDNIGTEYFPFARIEGAQIQRGALGTHCVTVYEEAVTFLGSGPGESPGVYMAANGQIRKISTREIDDILIGYSEEQLSEVVLETVNDKSHALLWVRMPDKTLVFDLETTQATQQPTWYIMSSGDPSSTKTYRGIDVVWCYDKWQVGDNESTDIGVMSESVATHFGDTVGWQFDTKILYNGSKGAVVNSLELVSLAGRAPFGTDPKISTSYSVDGRVWSQEKFVSIGVNGERTKRIVWRRQGFMRNMRVQRFKGDSNTYLAIARLEAELEPLAV